MKKTMLFLFILGLMTVAMGQNDSVPSRQDTIYGHQVVNTYLGYVDFSRMLDDSMLCVVTHITRRSHPQDTMTLYHWYMSNHRLRIEMWQDGKMQEGLYSDGTTLFRSFRSAMRSWVDLAQHSFYEMAMPYDIRGALYNWRAKGAEIYFAGYFTFQGHPVSRVHVSSPNLYDRYYFFERETGLLFMVTEEDKLYGDGKATKSATRVDWRAWNEFTPVGDCLLPTIESYQYQGDVVILKRQYHMEVPQPSLFTEDYHRMP